MRLKDAPTICWSILPLEISSILNLRDPLGGGNQLTSKYLLVRLIERGMQKTSHDRSIGKGSKSLRLDDGVKTSMPLVILWMSVNG